MLLNSLETYRRGYSVLTRRSFIRIVALAPFALQLEAKEAGSYTVEIRDLLMGTFVQIKGIGVSKETLADTISYMKNLERIFSRFDDESGLSALNREGSLKNPHQELMKVLGLAWEAHAETGGAFDVTVLPVLLHFERYGKALTQKEQERFRRVVGFEKVDLDSGSVSLKTKDMKLTLDGIAKGYIIDRGVGHLRDKGCAGVLVNVGGDIYCGKNQKGWDVGIYNPFQDAILRTLTLDTAAVCTSGNYVNYYSKDKKLHHIIDPESLTSPSQVVSVTAVARTTSRADILSTAIFVAGKNGRRFLKDGEKAYLITTNGREVILS
jgi:FAD:protein FMN transferase